VRRLALLAACSALALPCAARAAARFAVVIGNNHGAAGRARLWFAEKDAERFASALRELGDFAPDRIVLLQGGTPSAVHEALAATEARIAAARSSGERALLVVYFSGHAGPQGLELGDQRIGYDELRKSVTSSAAEAKVAIVDACEAGALTQVKGATAAPALDFPLPEDAVQGTAFLASTAVGESALESLCAGVADMREPLRQDGLGLAREHCRGALELPGEAPGSLLARGFDRRGELLLRRFGVALACAHKHFVSCVNVVLSQLKHRTHR